MSKRGTLDDLLLEFNSYDSTDDDANDLLDSNSNKAIEIISKEISSFSSSDASDGQMFALKLSQAVLATVAEKISSLEDRIETLEQNS